MRDRVWFESQTWLRQEADVLTSGDRIVRSHVENLDYPGVNTQPNFWIALDYLPALTPLISLPRPPHDPPLVGVSVASFLKNLQPSIVNTLGILGAAIGYLPETPSTQPQDVNCVPVSFGSTIPTIFGMPFVNGPADFIEYDPIVLPINGVNLPIWTRDAADRLNDVVKLNRGGPGIFWYAVLIQINGNLIATNVASLTTRWEWTAV